MWVEEDGNFGKGEFDNNKCKWDKIRSQREG